MIFQLNREGDMEKHAVCISWPLQGHIKPMLKLAQILHSKFDFHITFINTHHIQNTLFQSHDETSLTNHSTNASTTFTFESILDGVEIDIVSLIDSIKSRQLEPPLRGLLSGLRNKDYHSPRTNPTWPRPKPRPPITCMLTDITMSSFTLDVADDMGIPAVVLETASACGSLCYLQLSELLSKGIIPLPGPDCVGNGYLDMKIEWIASLKGIHLKDMPTVLRTMDSNDMLLNCVIANSFRALKSKALILINTFDHLEQDVLKELKTLSPNIYSVGPLHLLAKQMAECDANIPIKPTFEDGTIIEWLDSQQPGSILYVCFGSFAIITREKLVELAWGLANSQHKFLWAVRSDLVKGEPNSFIPIEFEKEVEGRGFLVKWCDQERVLAHPSIGGFLTHCGWNSTLESICCGVPMICCPLIAEQVTNSWYICNILGIGIKIREDFERGEVERVVKELMGGMKGKEMKKKAMEWRNLALEATMMSPYGSSFVNLERMVDDLHYKETFSLPQV